MDDVVVPTSSSTRHSCNVCGKGFPCGRSLGGHMRSHALAEVAAADEETTDSDEDDERRWIQSGAARASIVGTGGAGYGLRENPKKTRRLSRSPGGDDDVDDDEYGRDEQLSSCRPVFDDVRRHAPAGSGYSDGDDVRVEVEEGPEADDMLIRTEAAVVMAAPAPRRRRRSMRVPAPPPPREAFDKEPEDVALCLIMLSRDTAGLWGKQDKGSTKKARNGFYHDAADSDDNSALLQYADAEIARHGKKRKAASSAYAGGEKRGRYECPGCGRAFQSYQALGGHRASHKRINSNCCTTKVLLEQPEPSVETTASFSTISTPDADDADGAVKARKAIKFECPICFKVFGSGQALGGHKRSHSVAGELYDRNHADIVDTDQSLIAAGFLDLNLPAPGAED